MERQLVFRGGVVNLLELRTALLSVYTMLPLKT